MSRRLSSCLQHRIYRCPPLKKLLTPRLTQPDDSILHLLINGQSISQIISRVDQGQLDMTRLYGRVEVLAKRVNLGRVLAGVPEEQLQVGRLEGCGSLAFDEEAFAVVATLTEISRWEFYYSKRFNYYLQ